MESDLVVAALLQLALAAPIGALFGAAYGTSIRIGYEIIFPALFKDQDMKPGSQGVLDSMEKLFTGIGGLEAQKFGINQGIKNALKAIDADPELTELIKKNSNLDSQVITVNLSGNLTPPSSVQSPYSPSEEHDIIPDTTGGLAERHRKLRDKLTGKTDAQEFKLLSATYSALFKSFEKKNGMVNSEQLARLTNVNQNKNVRIWFVEWNFTWFTFSLQEELVKRTFQTTTDATSGYKVQYMSNNQLLQMFGGKSTQTLKLGLNKAKDNIRKWRISINSLRKGISYLQGFGNKQHLINPKKSQLNSLIKSYNNELQKIWNITMELKRRKK